MLQKENILSSVCSFLLKVLLRFTLQRLKGSTPRGKFGLTKSSSKHLDVLSNPAPVVCGHVGGVQQRVVLQHSVDDPLIVFGHSGGKKNKLSVRKYHGLTF